MADQTPAATAPAAPATTAQTTTAISPCGGSASTTAPAPGGAGESASGAAAAAGASGGMMGMLLPLAIFVLIFYFFIIRPQRKRQKQHNDLISGIGRGDQVITIGGFFGTVREVREDSFQIELAEGVRVRILKSAVQTKRVASEPTPTAALSDESKS